ncbi:MAG: extracellular solute-binding protein [Lachnospiraceae bacterium]|nr:extracellular solute-binding protein [Lachnospiraceae bacterium]
MKRIRLVSLLLATSMLFTACGGNTENVKEDNTNKNAIFKEDADVFQLEESDLSQITVCGDTIYVEQYVYDYNMPQARAEVAVEEVTEEVTEEDVLIEDTMSSTIRKIIGYGFDGTVKSKFTQQLDMNAGYGRFTADENGNIYSIKYQYPTYEGTDTKDKVYLEACAPDGSKKWEIYLNEKMSEGEYFYVSDIFCDEKGQIILDSRRGIEIYDSEGNPIKMIEKPDTQDCRLIRIRDGKYALIGSDGSAASIQTVDLQNGAFGEKASLVFNYYRYQVMSGLYYDIYLSDDYGVYGYNIGDAEITKLMDYISSDFASNYLYQISYIDENTFVAYYYGDEGGKLSKFTKVAPEDVIDKTEVILGCYYLEPDVKSKIIEFNKANTEYRINIKDYSTYDTIEDYTQGMTRLNADIVAGDVPDIMILNTQMPVESYAAKGIFADLNEFLEKDTEVKKDDLLPNILEALSLNGELYRIAPFFSVNTFAAKTADVGEEPGWTMDEALALLATKPEGTNLLSEMTASSFMYYTMWICGEQYVDWENGECHFDSDGFMKILEYANTLPRTIEYTAIMDDESYWKELDEQYRNGKTILNLQYLSGFRDYAYVEQAVFGEDITLIGFPTEEGNGAGLNIGTTMAISAISKHKDVAWEFVKLFLKEDYQDELTYNFPVRISSLRKLEEKAWEKPYYIDENGNKVEYDDYYYISEMEIPAVPLTQEETGEFIDYLMSLDKLCVYNEALNNIITEECESYFAGQKTAQEVADIIQSRAKIYVSENS